MSKNKDTHGGTGRGWIGVDLDGTLAEYHGWKGAEHIGKPIPKMVERVVGWLSDAEGPEVRILTARVYPGKTDADKCRKYIERWLEKHIVSKLPVHLREPFPIAIPITHEKDHMMVELWDDRCVQVIPNTGERADGKAESLEQARRPLETKVLKVSGNPEFQACGDCPFPLVMIPNYIGIDLCLVESVVWTKQADGQLVNLTINFIPRPMVARGNA